MNKGDAVKFNVHALVQDTNSLPAMETALAEVIAHQMIKNGFVRFTRTKEPGLTEFIRVTAEICGVPFEYDEDEVSNEENAFCKHRHSTKHDETNMDQQLQRRKGRAPYDGGVWADGHVPYEGPTR